MDFQKVYFSKMTLVMALLNGLDVGNETQWTQKLSTRVAVKWKLWDTFNYQI